MDNCLTYDVERYIVGFLLGDVNKFQSKYVFYKKPKKEDGKGVYIVPSGFFSKKNYLKKSSMPSIHGETMRGVRVLYGSSTVEKSSEKYVLYADLIASTFFVISRYEECIRRDCRDEHGRIIGRESILQKTDLRQKPFVEEYGFILRNCLREIGIECKEPSPSFENVYMTHDIDKPWTINRQVKGMIKEFISDVRGLVIRKDKRKYVERLLILFGCKQDPLNTFSWLSDMDGILAKTLGKKYVSIYFLMVCEKGNYDHGYICEKRRVKRLVEYLITRGALMGIHLSYNAGENPVYIMDEVKKYSMILNMPSCLSRHHYLMCREPEDMEYMINAGITDDFSCCFADGPGFRLGTCRPVKWINPNKMVVTPLVLHPLFLTETKIMNPNYMGLTFEEAKAYIRDKLLDIYKWSGEVCLLFHNTSVTEGKNQDLRILYEEVIKMICDISKEHSCNSEITPIE